MQLRCDGAASACRDRPEMNELEKSAWHCGHAHWPGDDGRNRVDSTGGTSHRERPFSPYFRRGPDNGIWQAMALEGTSGFGWLRLDEVKVKRSMAQQFDILADGGGLGARDLIARIPAVARGIVEFANTQQMRGAQYPKEHDWKPGAALLKKMLQSRSSAGFGGDLCGELICKLLIFIYTAEFVAVKPGTDWFDYADCVFVKAGTNVIVDPDYKGKKDVRYIAKGRFVEVDQIYIGFVYTEMNRLLRSSVTSVKDLTVTDTRKAMEAGKRLDPRPRPVHRQTTGFWRFHR
jgi:hypothetical protein